MIVNPLEMILPRSFWSRRNVGSALFTRVKASAAQRRARRSSSLGIAPGRHPVVAGRDVTSDVPRLNAVASETDPELPITRPMSIAAPELRILVAEDAKEYRDVLREELQRRGFAVTVAEDGASALRAFRSQVFDVVLTDLAMPGYNGLQVAHACKAQRPHVKVVLLTAWDLLLDDAECVEHGVDLVIAKPVPMRALAAALYEVASNPGRAISPRAMM